MSEPGVAPGVRSGWVGRAGRAGGAAAVAALALAIPFYVDASWLQVGLFFFAAAVAALGLNLLLGEAGQVSLAHSFFVAIGAYGYTCLAAGDETGGARDLVGAGLPPPLAAAVAVALAGAAGLAFSPVSARLTGIYLGVVSLGLVFVGQHLLFNLPDLTGGFNGRDVPDFALFGLDLGDPAGRAATVLGVPFGRQEKLWYLGLAALALVYAHHRNLSRGRVGRALRGVRDREVAVAALGVPVNRYKAGAFVVSSMYAALGGVLLALALRHVVPETFGLLLGIEYLVMVIVGGLGSRVGALLGAAFVVVTPVLFQRYADVLPLDGGGSGGLTPEVAARFAFGLAILLVLLFEPGGVAAIGRRIPRHLPGGASPTPNP